MKQSKCLIVFLAFLSATVLCSETLWAKTFRITIGSGYAVEPNPLLKKWRDEVCVNIKNRVESATEHKIEWVGAWAGAVAKVGEELNAIESGTLKMGMVATPVETSKLYLNSFGYNVPFGTQDVEKACRVNLDVYRKNKILQEVFERYNQKWLGQVSYETYDIITTFPFQKMADLKGKKIAALGANIPWLNQTGAVAVQSNSGEAYTSFQTGVYHGFLIPLSYTVGPKLFEVAKHVTFVGLGCPAGPTWTMNLDMWKSLPPKVQEIVWDEAQKFNDAVPAVVAKLRDNAIQVLKDKGVTCYTLSQDDRKEWMQVVKDMPKNFIKECSKRGLPGKQVVQSFLEETAKTGYTWPMKYELD
ncbi:MAG: TRAP transporter substrate-binding protein DctP [Thermodesulfobacteriota bacterium]